MGRERRQRMIGTIIGVAGTVLLFTVLLGWPLSTPVAAGITWLYQAVTCAAAGECGIWFADGLDGKEASISSAQAVLSRVPSR